MNPHNLSIAIFLFIGVVIFITGILTPTDEEAYGHQNKIKEGIPPQVQQIKLIGVGSMWIIAGILMLLQII